MSVKKKDKLRDDNVAVPRFFRELSSLLECLHDSGTERDRAGNRTLHYDQLCSLILLYFFNPVITSLRSIQQASELRKVQHQLGSDRASLGSLSEAMRVFDPELLQPIIAELGARLQPLLKDDRLGEIQKTITLVDGSVLKALPLMAEASFLNQTTGKGTVRWRLHTQFELLRGVPSRIDIARDAEKGKDERAMLSGHLEAGRCYIGDRGYTKAGLFNEIHDVDSNYVIRVKDDIKYDVVEERELSDEAQDLRVLSDEIVKISPNSDAIHQPNHTTRLIVIEKKAHRKHHSYKKTGPACDGYLRIVTDMLDVPAEIIAILYEYRWSIEIFFRNFKHLLGCRHLLSRSEDGIKIEIYCGIIACMLISLWTGKRPTLRTHEMICFYLMGWADEDELMAHIESLKKNDE
jgi:hypothetical protein